MKKSAAEIPETIPCASERQVWFSQASSIPRQSSMKKPSRKIVVPSTASALAASRPMRSGESARHIPMAKATRRIPVRFVPIRL
jgi:hypothetical protein